MSQTAIDRERDAVDLREMGSFPPSRPKLLVVEDDRDLSTVLCDLLELEGFSVELAGDPCDESAFDAVVFDAPADDVPSHSRLSASPRCVLLRRPFDADALLSEIRVAVGQTNAADPDASGERVISR